MAWLLAGFGLAALLMLFLHWWANTDVRSARQALLCGIVLICIAFALMLVAAGKGLMAIVPVGYAVWRMAGSRLAGRVGTTGERPAPHRGGMSRDEALEVLGLQPGASEDEINAAYRRLMAQVHPDKGGNDWMASKLNEARRTLLGK